MSQPPVSDSKPVYFALTPLFLSSNHQNAELLNNPESAPVRIVKPLQPPSFSAVRITPSSQLHQQPPSGALPQASSSTPAPGPSCGPAPASAGALKVEALATIQEDLSIDSHLGEEVLEEDFQSAAPAAAAGSSCGTKASYEDLTENTPARDQRRLKRQACVDSKETEC